ncbi:hypothetical protein PPYR_08383 [Photinus pyralis]|uniref:Uncharacterized protein n=1 Tax=Photinus pyralis TaxID=7054 RepID=A0A5N4AJA8_PHOPY|nr:larval cuticle protein LCP-22-like [Photinus pyralis]KAB0797389.1 hypothetical protein PPYR_08383 [Photinus pyralis]
MHRLVIWFTFVVIVVADVSHLYNGGNERQQKFSPALQNTAPFLPQLNRDLDYYPYRNDFTGRNIEILHQDNDGDIGGNYQWSYSTANGISAEEVAKVEAMGKNDAVKSVRGSYQYTSPEGIPVFVTYTADENGFQPHVKTTDDNRQIYAGRAPQGYYKSVTNRGY